MECVGKKGVSHVSSVWMHGKYGEVCVVWGDKPNKRSNNGGSGA